MSSFGYVALIAKDVQIQSLPVVLLSRKVLLNIEKNMPPVPLNRSIFLDRYVLFTLYYSCTKFEGELPIHGEVIAPQIWRMFYPRILRRKICICLFAGSTPRERLLASLAIKYNFSMFTMKTKISPF